MAERDIDLGADFLAFLALGGLQEPPTDPTNDVRFLGLLAAFCGCRGTSISPLLDGRGRFRAALLAVQRDARDRAAQKQLAAMSLRPN